MAEAGFPPRPAQIFEKAAGLNTRRLHERRFYCLHDWPPKVTVNAEPALVVTLSPAMPCRVHPDDRQAQALAGDLRGAEGSGPVEGLKDRGGVRRPICVAAWICQGQEAVRHLCLPTDPFHIRERRSAAGYVERIPCGLLSSLDRRFPPRSIREATSQARHTLAARRRLFGRHDEKKGRPLLRIPLPLGLRGGFVRLLPGPSARGSCSGPKILWQSSASVGEPGPRAPGLGAAEGGMGVDEPGSARCRPRGLASAGGRRSSPLRPPPR